MACLTSAIEPLRAANEIAGREAFTWTLIAETADRVKSSAKVAFDPDLLLQEVQDLDFLFLLSGPTGVFANPKIGNSKLRWLASRGVNLGGVSGGVFPLVRSGVMQGHRCSVHWCYKAAFGTEFPEMTTTDNVIAIDRRRYTVSGAAAAFDLMLRLIDDELGSEVMTEV
ncbi:MAG: AraC family transcriptional regulator, partial [Paracoccaceae bacterium]